MLVNYASGQVLKVEPITDGEDLAAANSQITAMTKAKTALKEAVNKAAAQSAKTRVLSAAPGLKDGRPVVSVDLLDGEQVRTVQQPMD